MGNWKEKFNKALSFSVFDFAGDNVKNRMLFPMMTMMVIGLVMLALLNSSPEAAKEDKVLKMELDEVYQHTLDSSTVGTREARMRLLDQDSSPIENVTVTIYIDSIMADRGSIGTICDTAELTLQEATLEAIRFRDVCRVKINNSSATTDKYGTVSVSNWTVGNGPQGIYTTYYQSESGPKTNTYKMFFQTPVAKIVSINSPPNTIQSYGVPLTTQPKVKVFNSDGEPVSNKTVIAVSWPEPYVNLEEGVSFDIQAEKFAFLENTESDPTDSDGVATFTNLTVVSSTSKNVYIIFIVDGTISTSWQNYVQSKLEVSIKMPFYPSAIPMESSGHTLISLQYPSSSVIEGEALDNQPIFQLLDSSSNPVSGVSYWILFAIVVERIII